MSEEELPTGSSKPTDTTIIDEGIYPKVPLDTSADALKDEYNKLLSRRVIPGPIHYDLVKQLGHGQQGTVFQATRVGARGCTTQHAVKILDPSVYSTPERYWTDMSRLAGQVSALHLIQNDNLINRDMYQEYQGVGYIQMSIIDGMDLRNLLDGTHLAIARSQSSEKEWKRFTDTLFVVSDAGGLRFRAGLTMYILRRCLLGLEAMHNNDFLHADLKPANIMIDLNGSIKIIDFGRAVRVGEDPSILLGTPAYMAPETHERAANLIASDLYSLGLVVLEMLCGKLDMKRHGVSDRALQQRKRELPEELASLLPENIPARGLMIKLLEKFLNPDPDQRFQTTREVLDESLALRALGREIALMNPEIDYARELQLYMEKTSNPETGHIHPGLQ